ncbi:MAG: hypothetical protein ACJA2S_004556 [Cyclobacteriaceae bacterium]|jgi:hypothetical protein
MIHKLKRQIVYNMRTYIWESMNEYEFEKQKNLEWGTDFFNNAWKDVEENPNHNGLVYFLLFKVLKRLLENRVGFIKKVEKEGQINFNGSFYKITPNENEIKKRKALGVGIKSFKYDEISSNPFFGYFLLEELKHRDWILRSTLHNLKDFSPDLKDEEIVFSDDERKSLERFEDLKEDKRYKNKLKTREQVRAIKDFAPELWNRLERFGTKKTRIEILHLITGRSGDECYKIGFNDDSEIDGMTEHIDKHEKLNNDLL